MKSIFYFEQKLKAESERSAENEKGLYLEIGRQMELRLSAEGEIEELQKEFESEQTTNTRVLEEERDTANVRLSSVITERDELNASMSMIERQLRESEGQRNNTLYPLDCVRHEENGNNDRRMLMISGCLGGALFVAICIILFLCKALGDKKMKKINSNSDSDDVMIVLEPAKVLTD